MAWNCGFCVQAASEVIAEATAGTANIARALRRAIMVMSSDQVMVHEQRREQHTQVDQREAECLAGERIGIRTPEAKAIPGESDAQRYCCCKVQPRTDAVGERHEARCK